MPAASCLRGMPPSWGPHDPHGPRLHGEAKVDSLRHQVGRRRGWLLSCSPGECLIPPALIPPGFPGALAGSAESQETPGSCRDPTVSPTGTAAPADPSRPAACLA